MSLNRSDFIKVAGLSMAAAAGLYAPAILRFGGREREGAASFALGEGMLPPPPKQEEMVNFLLGSSVIRSLDTSGEIVPLGVNYIAKDRIDPKKTAYARAEVIPWKEPFSTFLDIDGSGVPSNVIVAPIIIVEGENIFKPSLQYVCFGENRGARIAMSNHPDRVTQGEGKGSLAWDTVNLNTIKNLLKSGLQTKLHFAFTTDGGVLQNPNLYNDTELSLMNNLGQHSAAVMRKLRAGENFPGNNLLAYNFWVETIQPENG